MHTHLASQLQKNKKLRREKRCHQSIYSPQPVRSKRFSICCLLESCRLWSIQIKKSMFIENTATALSLSHNARTHSMPSSMCLFNSILEQITLRKYYLLSLLLEEKHNCENSQSVRKNIHIDTYRRRRNDTLVIPK